MIILGQFVKMDSITVNEIRFVFYQFMSSSLNQSPFAATQIPLESNTIKNCLSRSKQPVYKESVKMLVKLS